MKALSRLVARVVLFAAQLVVFVLVTGLASKGYSHLAARTFEDGSEPPRHFPLVAVAGDGRDRYRLVRWGEREGPENAASGLSFQLPASQGRFALPPIGAFRPSVRFEVLEVTAAGQRVAVTWADDDYVSHARYVTDGVSVIPEYFRIWGGMMAMIGVLPGILAAWLFGRLLRRARAARSRPTTTS